MNGERAPAAVVLLGRLGLFARGAVYLLVGGLAVASGLGLKGGQLGDQREALAQLHHWPLGSVILWTVAGGLAAYVAWRAVQLFTARKMTTRGIALVSGTIYAGIVASALLPLLGLGRAAGKDRRVEESVAWLMEQPLGAWMVLAGGAGVAVAATWQFVQAVAAFFARHLEGEHLSPEQRRWACWSGRIGYAVRGIAFALVAVFLFHAGFAEDATRAGGMEEALRALSRPALGWLWVVIAGTGLATFGVWSIIESRFRSRFC